MYASQYNNVNSCYKFICLTRKMWVSWCDCKNVHFHITHASELAEKKKISIIFEWFQIGSIFCFAYSFISDALHAQLKRKMEEAENKSRTINSNSNETFQFLFYSYRKLNCHICYCCHFFFVPPFDFHSCYFFSLGFLW